MTLTIHDLPIEFLLDHLLPILEHKDLLALTCTDKAFAILCSDDMMWRRKLKSDLNYSIVDARDKGFKLLYRGIRRPHVYVWGSYGDSRLGLKDPEGIYNPPSVSLGRGIPFPVELPMTHMRTVSIVAGGWSFAALDDEGLLHVWGKLDAEGGQWNFGRTGLGESSHEQRTPVTLKLPNPITTVTAGRRHLLALDSKQGVWLFGSWGRPALLTTSQLSVPTPSLKSNEVEGPFIAQIECGWDIIAILLSSGTVLVEWPFEGPLGEKIGEHHADRAQDPETHGKDTFASNGNLTCAIWELDHVLLELPAIPNDLPDLGHAIQDDYGYPILPNGEDAREVKLVKIAAGDGFIIGLTNHGHVLKLDLSFEEDIGDLRVRFRQGITKWTYLPEFSELEKVQAGFSEKGVTPPESLFVSHISATFKTFVVYSTGSLSSSVVLLGNSDTTAAPTEDSKPRPDSPSPKPTIIPKLQHRNVVSVVLGDYHFLALTEDGVLLSWGEYSTGALGLGDPEKLETGSPGGYDSEPGPGPAREAQHIGGPPGPTQGTNPDGSTFFRVPIFRRGPRIRSVPDVKEPSEVRFDHLDGKRDKFVFAVAASGWHSAALVIDLDPSGPAADRSRVAEKPSNESKGKGRHFTIEDEVEAAPPWTEREEGSEPDMPGAFYPRVRTHRGGGVRPRTHEVSIPLPPDRSHIPESTSGSSEQPRQPLPTRTSDPSSSIPSFLGTGRGFLPFRVGFAGRGAYRGQGVGRQLHSPSTLQRLREHGSSGSQTQTQTQSSDNSGTLAGAGDQAVDAEPYQGTELPSGGTTGEERGARVGSGASSGPGRVLAGGFRGLPGRGRGIGHSQSSSADEHAAAPSDDIEESSTGQDQPHDAETSTPESAGGAGPGVGNHPLPMGIRGIRIGFAGRGAFRGTGLGRALMEAQGATPPSATDSVDNDAGNAEDGEGVNR